VSAAEASLAQGRPQAACLIRNKLLHAKTVPARHATLVVIKPVQLRGITTESHAATGVDILTCNVLKNIKKWVQLVTLPAM